MAKSSLGEYMETGQEHMQERRYAGAVEGFGKTIEIQPDNGKARYCLATAKENLSEPDKPASDREVISYCDKAIGRGPESASGWYPIALWARGMSKEILDNQEEAVRDISRAIGLNPEIGCFRFSRGKIKFIFWAAGRVS